jgi:hypothetical protein
MQGITYNPTSDINRAIVEKWYPLATQADIQFFYNCLLFHGRVDRMTLNGEVLDLTKTPVIQRLKDLPDGHNMTLFVQIGWISPTIELKIQNVRELYFPLLQVLSYGVLELRGDKVTYYDNNKCSVVADKMSWRYHSNPLHDSSAWKLGEV